LRQIVKWEEEVAAVKARNRISSKIPPLHGYWDRLAPQDQGEQDEHELYHAVGEALSGWESGVEGSFAVLFGHFMHADQYAAQRVYGTLSSGGAKKSAMLAAAEAFFQTHNCEPAFNDDLELLLNHHGNAISRRNDIAHGIVTCLWNWEEHLPIGFFLVPPFHATKKVKHSAKYADMRGGPPSLYDYRFVSEDIYGFADKFMLLDDWIRRYSERVMDRALEKKTRK
jgi:hypothetical protein